MKRIKNKKTLIILLVLCIGLVGLTIAYFSNSTTIDNLFTTKEYGTTYTETFVSPDNWLPGDTTDKTVVVTNSGEVDEAVRISLSETWIPNNTNITLTGWIHADGTKSNHTTEEEIATDVRAAVINFTDNSDWKKVGDYYYYNYKLAPGETTDSLIESVTFNTLTKLDDTCTPSTNNGTTTIVCNSSGSDYDHATYKLTINIETVQYNKYQVAWGTNVAIAEEKISSGVNYLLSNAINTDGAEYNAQTKSKMFKLTHLATEQTPAQTEYRYIGDNPNNYVYFNCDSLDNQSSSTCEVWRIIGVFDVDDGTGNYEQRIKLIRGNAISGYHSWDIEHNDWINSSIESYLNGDYFNREGYAINYGLKDIAQEMTDDVKYYLGALSKNNSTFGSAEQLYIEERGNITCGTCNNDSSKLYWIGKIGLLYPSDAYLVYANGVEDGCYENPKICYFKEASCATCEGNYNYPETSWIYNTNLFERQSNLESIWLLSTDSNMTNVQCVVSNNGKLDYGFGGNVMRPVLYLKPTVTIIGGEGSIDNPYKLSEKNINTSSKKYYSLGETISYKNNNYCVIRGGSSDDEFLTLIKSDPLTYDELVMYNNDYEIERDAEDNNIGIIRYYKGGTCESENNDSGCSNEYNNSYIKNVVNNWSESFKNDLKEVNGYKTRLITSDELNSMGHIFYLGTAHAQVHQKSEYDCLYSNADYWTMSNTGDSQNEIDIVSKVDNNNKSQKVYSQFAIRPVINLKTCAITNTCE